MAILITLENISPTLKARRIPDDVIAALYQVLRWSEMNSNKMPAAYAAAYLREIDRAGLFSQNYIDGFKTQILYVLSNLGGWRGEEARQSKKILKDYTKGV